MQKIDSFKLKDGREVSIIIPDMSGLGAITSFVNKLAKEDTFLSFIPDQILTLEHEEVWLKNCLLEVKNNNLYLIWAVCGSKIIGSIELKKGGNRRHHTGRIALMVDKDFRGKGLGRFLMELVVKKAKLMNISIISLEVFSDNEIAISLYKKLGFVEYGRLPNGFYRQEKYSDEINMYKDQSDQ